MFWPSEVVWITQGLKTISRSRGNISRPSGTRCICTHPVICCCRFSDLDRSVKVVAAAVVGGG